MPDPKKIFKLQRNCFGLLGGSGGMLPGKFFKIRDCSFEIREGRPDELGGGS